MRGAGGQAGRLVLEVHLGAEQVDGERGGGCSVSAGQASLVRQGEVRRFRFAEPRRQVDPGVEGRRTSVAELVKQREEPLVAGVPGGGVAARELGEPSLPCLMGGEEDVPGASCGGVDRECADQAVVGRLLPGMAPSAARASASGGMIAPASRIDLNPDRPVIEGSCPGGGRRRRGRLLAGGGGRSGRVGRCPLSGELVGALRQSHQRCRRRGGLAPLGERAVDRAPARVGRGQVRRERCRSRSRLGAERTSSSVSQTAGRLRR